jgi:hypothetical protein
VPFELTALRRTGLHAGGLADQFADPGDVRFAAEVAAGEGLPELRLA